MYIEKKIYELDNKLTMYHESLRRLTSLLQVVDQIHRAPRVYVSAITEVARRNYFSQAFVEVSVAVLEKIIIVVSSLIADVQL